MTQMARVHEYIENHGSITRAQAMNDIGVANLPAVIADLRKKGVAITTLNIEANNRYGEKISYAKYILNKSEDQ